MENDRRAIDPDVHRKLYDMVRAGQSTGIIAKLLSLSVSTVSKYRNIPPPQVVSSDKKYPEMDWREWVDHAKRTQKLYRKASATQKFAHIELGDGTRPVCLLPFSDQHIGGRGVLYDEFERMTDEIVDTPDLYVALLNDLEEYAIKLRSVAEVCAQIFGPDKQDQFVEQWFDYIAPKVAFATWSNHEIERAEKQSGSSFLKRIMSKRVVFFDGIGHADIKVGEQVYHFAASHKFRGYSYMNACHAGSRYMRFEGVDREIAIMGDIHTPAFAHYYDGPRQRLSLVAGTLNVDSVYANRYFSIFTQPQFPCIELNHKHHEFTPFKNVGQWLKHRGK